MELLKILNEAELEVLQKYIGEEDSIARARGKMLDTKHLGSGAFRDVYSLSDRYVIKIGRGTDGIRSNKMEWNTYNYYKHNLKMRNKLAKCFYMAEDGSYIIMERCEITVRDYRGLLILEEMDKFDKKLDIFENFIHDNSVIADTHYGNMMLTANNKLKVVDYGLVDHNSPLYIPPNRD